MTSREEFILRMTALARAVPNFLLSKELLLTYERLLAPLGYEKLNQALDQILMERDSRDPFPSIKEIRIKVDPALDPAGEAIKIATLIVGGVAKHGPYNVERAKAEIGELGWTAVKISGGWESICDALTNQNRTMMITQFRDLILSIASTGATPRPAPAIESKSEKSPKLLSIGQILLQIPEKAGNGIPKAEENRKPQTPTRDQKTKL
jgi:hypothetical protein